MIKGNIENALHDERTLIVLRLQWK
jgi:hypothetical protein